MINYKDELSKSFTEDNQTILLELLDHIGKKQEGSIMDYVLDFCEVNSYHIEDVAELIKNNKNIRMFFKEDCIFNGIIRPKKPNSKLEDW